MDGNGINNGWIWSRLRQGGIPAPLHEKVTGAADLAMKNGDVEGRAALLKELDAVATFFPDIDVPLRRHWQLPVVLLTVGGMAAGSAIGGSATGSTAGRILGAIVGAGLSFPASLAAMKRLDEFRLSLVADYFITARYAVH